MLGLFGTLNLASRSLAAQQEAMSVAGQNMANVNNSAYADEQAVIQTSDSIETTAGEEGTGVQVVSITETRDSLLDNQIQSENSVTGSFTAQQTALQNAEAFLGEELSSSSTSSSSSSTSSDGLSAMLSNLFNSFSSMTTGSGDAATVVQAAQEVTNQFNQVSANLSQVRSNLNTSIQNGVASCNQDLNEIATLNQQIVQAEAGGGTANDLVDTRQQTIENLAGMVNISTSAQSNGSVNISIGGVSMVAGGSAVNGLQTYDAGGGQLLIQDENSATPLSVTGGSIAGNITARDGALSTLQTSLDTLASQLVTQVNNIYSAGYDSSGGTGQLFFTGNSAASIGVNSALVSDPSQFQASSTAGAGGDTQIALALANLATQTVPALGNQSLSQSYAQTVANLGNAIDTATDQLNTSQAISTSLTNQRSSESGVSIDQEMTNVMEFQKAYEASAQLVTTLDNMMETVIDMKPTTDT
jgi:flagellar hook-associated protein 1 FlgK